MSRTLRSVIRRKMEAGEGDDLDEKHGDNATVEESDNVVGSEKEFEHEDGTETSTDEEEMEELQRRFKGSSLQQEKGGNKERLKRLRKELKQVEGRVKRRKKSHKGKNKLTQKELRSMKEVEKKISKLMEKCLGHLNGKKKSKGKSKSKRYEIYSSQSESSSSSEDSETDSDTDDVCSSCSSSSSCEQSDSYRDNKKEHCWRKKSKSKSSGRKKTSKRSGKSRKISSNVKYPQQWPHSQLSLHFVSKDKKYDDLSVEEFCAGYATILENTHNKTELKYRIVHLKDLMYLATKYRWDCVMSFHAACLLEIERGHIGWGDSFQSLQITTLAGGFLQTDSVQQRSKEGPVVFCRNFQRGWCTEESDHFGDFNGATRYLRHICAKCWLLHKRKAPHPETADDCPSKEE